MNRRSDADDPVDQQDRSAVSDKNRQRNVLRGRHDSIHRRWFALPWPVHQRNVRAMALAHEEEMVSWNVKSACHQPAVGLDR